MEGKQTVDLEQRHWPGKDAGFPKRKKSFDRTAAGKEFQWARMPRPRAVQVTPPFSALVPDASPAMAIVGVYNGGRQQDD